MVIGVNHPHHNLQPLQHQQRAQLVLLRVHQHLLHLRLQLLQDIGTVQADHVVVDMVMVQIQYTANLALYLLLHHLMHMVLTFMEQRQYPKLLEVITGREMHAASASS